MAKSGWSFATTPVNRDKFKPFIMLSILIRKLSLIAVFLIQPALHASVPTIDVNDETLDIQLSVEARMQGVLGDPGPLLAFFNDLQQAVEAKDVAALSQMMGYPFPVLTDDRILVIRDSNDFAKHFEHCFTEEVIEAVRKQNFEALFVNYKGCMIGRGEVWFNYHYRQNGLTDFKSQVVKVTTLRTGSPSPSNCVVCVNACPHSLTVDPGETKVLPIHPKAFELVVSWMSDNVSPVVTGISLDAVRKNYNQFDYSGVTVTGFFVSYQSAEERGYLYYQITPLDDEGKFLIVFFSNGGGTLTVRYFMTIQIGHRKIGDREVEVMDILSVDW